MAGSHGTFMRSSAVTDSPLWLGVALSIALAACDTGRNGSNASNSSALPGTLARHADGLTNYIVGAHHGGVASSVHLVGAHLGRLVDIHDFDASTGESQLVLREFLVPDTLASDGVDLRLDRDPFTELDVLTILHPMSSAAFLAVLAELEGDLQSLGNKSLDPAELPPYISVPRNAAIALTFDDLLDENRINASTVQLRVGYPPVQPHDARLIADRSHGDVVGGVFHTTRVLVDFTVSRFEAVDTLLATNAEGLPEALFVAQPNVAVRVPTRIGAGTGLVERLTNLAGRAVSFNGSGANDPTSASLDVLRAFRSRGRTLVTGDPNDGFLPDHIAPTVVGEFVVGLLATQPIGAGRFALDLMFHDAPCAVAPREGDVIELQTHWLRVAQDHAGAPLGGIIEDVLVDVLHGNPAAVPAVNGELRSRFVGASPECFVRVLSGSTGAPSVDARVVLHFSEPMRASTVRAMETLALDYGVAPSDPLQRHVVGAIHEAPDLRSFTFVPSLPLRHGAGEETPYVVRLGGGASGVTDLAGNPLELALPDVTFELHPGAPAIDSDGVTLHFDASDENGDGGRELRGQFVFEPQFGRIKPRAVTRFSSVVDPSVPTVGAMRAHTQGLVTPLSPYGSRTMLTWRYHDAGLSLLDETAHNIDVEGLYYEPFDGALQVDQFDQFEMALAHSKRLPDEAVAGAALLPIHVDSGLVQIFDQNFLEPRTVVHEAAKGLVIASSDLTLSMTGAAIAPWPLNRNVAPSEYRYWTWRDTGKLDVGAPFGAGADTQRLQQVSKVAQVGFYPPNAVPTIGLPLLTEFRTWPDATATGQNGFKVAIAITSSAQPYFRVFSTGGVNPLDPLDVQIVQPSNEPSARGGINPNATQQNQVHTFWGDNTVYYGQADFVVRVSRAHSAWFELGAPSQIATPVLEPRAPPAAGQAQLLIAMRGASAMAGSASVAPWRDAENLDAYGDGFTVNQLAQLGRPAELAFTPQFVHASGDPSNRGWTTVQSTLNTSRFAQLRLTFIGDPQSGVVPTVEALGVAFRR